MKRCLLVWILTADFLRIEYVFVYFSIKSVASIRLVAFCSICLLAFWCICVNVHYYEFKVWKYFLLSYQSMWKQKVESMFIDCLWVFWFVKFLFRELEVVFCRISMKVIPLLHSFSCDFVETKNLLTSIYVIYITPFRIYTHRHS